MNPISRIAPLRLPVGLVLLTNLSAGFTYITTGFPPWALAVLFLLVQARAWWASPTERFRNAIQLLGCGCFAFLALWQWRTGQAGIVVLANFTMGILAVQTLLLLDGAAAYRCLVLSGMVVLASGAMNVNFLFPLGLFPYSLLLTITLFALAGYRQALGKVLAQGEADPRFPRSAFVLGLFLTGVGWLGLFYLFPRSEAFGLASTAGQKRLMGFSDTLRLGEAGKLGENLTIVMRVKPVVMDPVPAKIVRNLQKCLLRGVSFHSYQRGSWLRSDYGAFPVNMRRNNGELRIRAFPDDPRPDVTVEILLENTDPPVMFLPDQTQVVYTDLPHLTLESDGAITFSHRRTHLETYRALVKLGKESDSPSDPQSVPFFPPFLRPFIETGDLSLLVQETALSATAGVSGIREQAEAVQRYLRRTCEYSLEETIPPGIRDPVAHFLFQSRRGSCEHFASTMVLMLRSLGIPARPVNGYILDEWNEFGGYFTVRQSHAHSWAEVFLPNKGWTTFDPTPPAIYSRPTAFLTQDMEELWNWFEAFWLEYVYSFDRQAQIKGFRVLDHRFRRLIRWSDPEWQMFNVSLPVVFLLIAIAGGILFLLRRRKSHSFSSREQNRWIPDWYRHWEASLPLVRRPWETPREFHARLKKVFLLDHSAAGLLEKIAGAVDASAFAATAPPGPVSPQEDLSAFSEILAETSRRNPSITLE
jgi:hypothetical protein